MRGMWLRCLFTTLAVCCGAGANSREAWSRTPRPSSLPSVSIAPTATPAPSSVPTLPRESTDFLALKAFYSATRGPSWRDKRNWMSGTPCNNQSLLSNFARGGQTLLNNHWKGVECYYDFNNGEHRVSALVLPRNKGMAGTLPSELGLMKGLVGLFVGHGKLKGDIPTEMGQLTGMRLGLEFDYNHLNSALPTQLGKLTASAGFAVRFNKISGAIPSQLGLMRGSWPGCPKDIDVDSTLCRVATIWEKEHPITKVDELLNISLASRNISWRPVFGGYSLDHNKMSQTIPSQLGNLKNMTLGLTVNDNSLSGSIPTEFGQLTKIKLGFSFDSNSLSGTLPSQFGLLSHGMYVGLTLYGNKKTVKMSDLRNGTKNQTLRTCKGVEEGRAQTCETGIMGSLPTQLGRLSNVVNGFAAFSNRITGTLPTEFGAFSTLLFELNTHTNSITGSLPTELGRLTQFRQRFFIQRNNLTGSIPTQLGRLSLNRQLYFFSNRLSGTLPSEIGNMRALTQLFLQSNSLRGSIPAQIGNMTGLIKTDSVDRLIDDINLVCEDLHLNVPELNNMSVSSFQEKVHDWKDRDKQSSSTTMSPGGLRYLLLDNNHFKHSIPETICKLQHLHVFSAFRNQLSGTVPRCHFQTSAGPTCSFKYLQTLNLARNQLHGDVPFVLGCTKLQYLLLHHNLFTGGLQSLISHSTRMYNGTILLDGNLSAVTLHNNRLDQHLPKDLMMPSSLSLFTLSNNQIPGKVPRNLLSQLDRTAGTTHNMTQKMNGTTLMLNNNRLSCDLPKKWTLKLTPSSLILMGNLFSMKIPKWVTKPERQSFFLSTVRTPLWRHTSHKRLPMWEFLLLQFVAVSLFTGVVLHYIERSLKSNRAREGRPIAPRVNAFIRRLLFRFALFAAGAVVCSLPIYVAGSQYFQCGDALMKYTTIAYLDSPGTNEYLAYMFLGAYTIVLAFMLSVFVPRHTIHSSTQNGLRNKESLFQDSIINDLDIDLDPNDPLLTNGDEEWQHGQDQEQEGPAIADAGGAIRSGPISVQPTEDLNTPLLLDASNGEEERQNQLERAQNTEATRRKDSTTDTIDATYDAEKGDSSKVEPTVDELGTSAPRGAPIRLEEEYENHGEDTADRSNNTNIVDTMEGRFVYEYLGGGSVEEMDDGENGTHEDAEDNEVSSSEGDTLSSSDAELNLRDSMRISLGREIRRASPLTQIRCYLYFFVWTIVVTVVGGGPTFLWILSYSMPPDNVIVNDRNGSENGVVTSLIYILNEVLALYLAIFSTILLPALTRGVVGSVLKVINRTDIHEIHKLETILSIVARTVLVILLPIAAVVIFNDGCFGKWTEFWTPCNEDYGTHGLELDIAFTEYVSWAGEQTTECTAVTGTITTQPVQDLTDNVCHGKGKRRTAAKLFTDLFIFNDYSRGNCARSVLTVLGPLVLEKMIYAVLLSALRPVIIELVERVRRWRKWQEPPDVRPPNPMLLFVNLETALVFGATMPLLLPLLLFQLYVDSRTFQWLLSRKEQRVHHQMHALPVQWRAMQCHTILVMMLQSGMVAFTAWDTAALHSHFDAPGHPDKIGTGPMVAIVNVLFLVAAALRTPLVDFLRCRWRRCSRCRRRCWGLGARMGCSCGLTRQALGHATCTAIVIGLLVLGVKWITILGRD